MSPFAIGVVEFERIDVQGIALVLAGGVRGGCAAGSAAIPGTVIADAAEGVGIGVAADGEADGAAVGGADNVALHIRAVQFYICITQTAYYLVVGVTVGVVLTAGDHRILGHDIPKELVAGGSVGAVMSHLQYRSAEAIAAIQQSLLHFRFCVAGEEEGGIAIDHTQHDGGVVGIGGIRVYCQNGAGGAAQGELGAYRGYGNRCAPLLNIGDKVSKSIGVVGGDGAVDLTHGGKGQGAG